MNDPRVWTVAFETLAIASGAWMISAARINDLTETEKWMVPKSCGVSRFILHSAVFGTQHFMYSDFIITLMPAWLPGVNPFWSYVVRFTFAGSFVAALNGERLTGVCFLLGIMFLNLACHAMFKGSC